MAEIRKIFFHHLAKVGGGSVRTLLDGWKASDQIAELRYGGHEALSEDVKASITQDGFFKILFVRDPVDRFVSAFNFYVTHAENAGIPEWDRRWIKLRGEFLKVKYGKDINRMIEEEARDGFAFLFDCATFPHFTPIKDQYKSIEFYDFVGRTETLPRDLERIADSIGIDRTGVDFNIKANVSPRWVSRADISEENIRILKECFSREYEDLEALRARN